MADMPIDVEALTPRQLDDLAASLVLGWRDERKNPRFSNWVLPDRSRRLSAPLISTDIAAAMQAVTDLGINIVLEGQDGAWLCSDHNAYDRTHRDSIDATAPTPALAIARFLVKQAALKAAAAPMLPQ